MRSKKSLINAIINIFAFIITFLPNIILRSVVLKKLGANILGLTSLYNNIIGWLSIVEMGITVAIIYSLYKPFAEDDKKKVNMYITFYGKFYKKIGSIILIIGISLTPFLNLFVSSNVKIGIEEYIAFVIILFNTFISYMFTHRFCIFTVAQKNYKLVIGTTISKVCIVIIQLIILKYIPSFIYYSLVQLLINFVYYLLVNLYIKIKYPWIYKDKESLNKDEERKLYKNIKALFINKIGGVITFNTDNIVISKFVGLIELANVSNYYIIISAAQNLVYTFLSSATSSIGNLLVEKDTDYSYDIFKKMLFLNYIIASLSIIVIYNTLDQFIIITFGNKYMIDKISFIAIIINLYFTMMRTSIEAFQQGSGNFEQDKYIPLIEGGINLSLSLIFVNTIGLPGVFIATLISNFTVVFWSKPYIVYKYVFKRNIKEYFYMYVVYSVKLLICLFISVLLFENIKTKFNITFFITNVILNILLCLILQLILFYKTDEFKYYVKLIKKILNKKVAID